MVTDADVLKRWKYIAQDDEKLLILIGGPGSGKSKLIRELTFQDGWKICEARELFDDEFLEIPRADRPDKAIALVSAAIHRLNARVVMIDNVEFLFAPILNLDPVAMLKKLSRECPIIVSWRGSLEGNTLYFEHNGDPKNSSSTTRITSFAWMNKGRFSQALVSVSAVTQRSVLCAAALFFCLPLWYTFKYCCKLFIKCSAKRS